jgi:Resolvase, N terminal domain
MYIGYARVSTHEQHLDLQQDALQQVGCQRIIVDRVSGTVAERPGLRQIKDLLRAGDTLVVWRLDRLGRSIKDLIEWVHWLEQEGAGLKSLQEAIDTTSTGGKLPFHLCGTGRIRTAAHPGAQASGIAGGPSPRPLGRTPTSVDREPTEAGSRAVPGEAVGRAGNLHDDGDLQADPLCLCPSGTVLLLVRLRPFPHERYPYAEKVTRAKTAGQDEEAPTTASKTILTAVSVMARW